MKKKVGQTYSCLISVDNNCLFMCSVLALNSTKISLQCPLVYREMHVAGHSLVFTFEKKNLRMADFKKFLEH